VAEDPPPTNDNGAQEESPARQDVDVHLDVSELEVDRIKLTAKDLRAHISVLAELASLLNLQVGVHARDGQAGGCPWRAGECPWGLGGGQHGR
jgi:hypothetical protein